MLRSTEAKATGTRSAYDLSLVYLSGGKRNTDCQLKWSAYIGAFALLPAKGEQTGNLYAVYVDDAGRNGSPNPATMPAA